MSMRRLISHVFCLTFPPVVDLCIDIVHPLVVYKLEFDAKSRGRTEAKQHMTPKIQTHSLTKNQLDTKTHVLVGVSIHRKEIFNILDFLHRINVRKRVKIIPHLCEREMHENAYK